MKDGVFLVIPSFAGPTDCFKKLFESCKSGMTPLVANSSTFPVLVTKDLREIHLQHSETEASILMVCGEFAKLIQENTATKPYGAISKTHVPCMLCSL